MLVLNRAVSQGHSRSPCPGSQRLGLISVLLEILIKLEPPQVIATVCNRLGERERFQSGMVPVFQPTRLLGKSPPGLLGVPLGLGCSPGGRRLQGKEFVSAPLGPVLQGDEGLGWHAPSCQVVSHYFLWLSSLTNCFLQLRYPIYQLEAGIKAWASTRSSLEDRRPPLTTQGCPCLAPRCAAAGGPRPSPAPQQPPCPPGPLWLSRGPSPTSGTPRSQAPPGNPSLCCRLGRLVTFCWT